MLLGYIYYRGTLLSKHHIVLWWGRRHGWEAPTSYYLDSLTNRRPRLWRVSSSWRLFWSTLPVSEGCWHCPCPRTVRSYIPVGNLDWNNVPSVFKCTLCWRYPLAKVAALPPWRPSWARHSLPSDACLRTMHRTVWQRRSCSRMVSMSAGLLRNQPVLPLILCTFHTLLFGSLFRNSRLQQVSEAMKKPKQSVWQVLLLQNNYTIKFKLEIE